MNEHMEWPHDADPLTGVRLVVFGQGAQYDMRSARRERVLRMHPVDPTEAGLVESARRDRIPGVYWEYLHADDSPLMLRARDLADEDEARWDADRVFSAFGQLRVVYTRDRDSGQYGWWLVRDRDVVLVSPRPWPSTERNAVANHARRALRALRRQPPWGGYAP